MPADPGILKRIRRCPFARGGRVTVRFRANGYSLYSRRSNNLPLARLRLTGEAERSSCSIRPTAAAGSHRATSAQSPCRSTRPSKPSAPIHTSYNCARTSIELIRSARSSHSATRFPVNFSLFDWSF